MERLQTGTGVVAGSGRIRGGASLALRTAIGLLLIFSGSAKIAAAEAFARSISLMKLTVVANLFLAFGIPIGEIFLGVAFLVGYRLRSAIFVSFLMLAVFTVYIVSNYQSVAGNCGCYGDLIWIGFDEIGIGKNLLMMAGLVSLHFKLS